MARSRATSTEGAPETFTSSSLVAPSPSAAISLARSSQSSTSAAVNAVRSGPASTINGLLACPLANANTASLVLMSLSTVRLLKLVSIACRSALPRAWGMIAQSVATTAIIVAS